LPLVADGRIQAPIEAAFALEGVQAAYALFEAGAKLGKIVLEVSGSGEPGFTRTYISWLEYFTSRSVSAHVLLAVSFQDAR